MGDLVTWLILVVAIGAVVLPLALWDERRTARRRGRLLCPVCRLGFGPEASTTWGCHYRYRWRGRWDSGPYLTCRRCGIGFRYTRAGELHPEQFDPAAERPTRRRT